MPLAMALKRFGFPHTAGRRGRTSTIFRRVGRQSVALEVLHRALVLLRGGARLEGAEVAALAGLGIGLARIEAVFARRKLADHGDLRRCRFCCHPERSEGPLRLQERSLAALGMTTLLERH